MHLQNSLTKRNFKAGSWISEQKFAQKRRISRSCCSGSRDRINIINPKSITWKDFSDCDELDLMMAAELKWCYDIAYLIHEITERSAATRQEGRKNLTPSGRLKNVFSGRQLGLLQEETLVVFYTRMPRETVRIMWDEVQRRKKFSPRASILFSTESERHRLTGKAWTVQWPVLWLKLKKSLTIASKMKKTLVWLSTSSRVSWLQVWNRCLHGYRCLFRHAEWWEENQREVEK